MAVGVRTALVVDAAAALSRLPARIEDVCLSLDGVSLTRAARVLALLPGRGAAGLRSLCVLSTSDPDADVAAGRDAVVLGGLTALTYLAWGLDHDLHAASRASLSSRALGSVVGCRGLTVVHLDFEVDAEAAAALLALPLLEHLSLVGPAPLPRDFDALACLSARGGAPLGTLVFADRMLLDWTSMLLLVDPSGRHRVCRRLLLNNKWTCNDEDDDERVRVALRLGEDDFARCAHLMGCIEYEMRHLEKLDALVVDAQVRIPSNPILARLAGMLQVPKMVDIFEEVRIRMMTDLP